MRRYKLAAVSAATIIAAGVASTVIATQGAGSSSPSANTQGHKASPTITAIVPPRTLVVAPTTTTTSITTTTLPKVVAPVVPPAPPVAAQTTTAPAAYPYGVTPADVVAWTRVAVCEEGGNWHVRGYKYSGGLGILNYNWTYYSRGMGLPASAADATPIQQIAVAKRINAGYAVPDQNGCAAW